MAEKTKNEKTKDEKTNETTHGTVAGRTDQKAEGTARDSGQAKASIAGSPGKAADKVEEVKASARGQAPEVEGDAAKPWPGDGGSGGDIGSGPTGGIEADEVSASGRRPALMGGAAFALGLVTGLLIGWFLSD